MTDVTVRDPRPATAPDNAAISVTEMGTRRIVDLKQKGLIRALLPVAVAGLCVGVALIVAQQFAGRFPGRPEYALVGLSAFWPPFAAYHFVISQFVDRERLSLTAEGVELRLGLGFGLRRREAPWSDVSIVLSRPAEVRAHRDVPAFSPWKRAWMGGVLITFGDKTVRVGGWLFDEDAEELRALIEEMRPPPGSVDDDGATETPPDRKIRVVERLDEA